MTVLAGLVRSAGLVLALAGTVDAQPAGQPLLILDVPFISQSEDLCGGAAAAMVLRYWGERELRAESFAHLVDRSAAGIRTDALLAELQTRGWKAVGLEGTVALMERELASSRPVLTLIEDRPGRFHYVVVVAAAPRAVVFHDPARAPFRVMPRDQFERRWNAADRWMAVILPQGTIPTGLADRSVASPERPETACERLVNDGIRLAQSGELDEAERSLGAALSCPGAAALRELAGVRLLQRRWPEVMELASAAVAEEPGDAHAWRLLATSRFVQNDRARALDAWNRVGEPRLDLITVAGLTRTRQRAVEQLIDLDAGRVLTHEKFRLAARRLADLPSTTDGRLEYVPVPPGLAELRAAVVERPLMPMGWVSYAGLGLNAAVRRELAIPISAPSGGGERIDLRWRFWSNRPRTEATMIAPAPWGGLWAVSGSWERQPFDASLAPAERQSFTAETSNWLTSWFHGRLGGGADIWRDGRSHPRVGAALQFVTRGDLLAASAAVDAWPGENGFSAAQLGVSLKSSAGRRGIVYLARHGIAVTSHGTPLDLWFAGDTGHARTILLRAHPLLDAAGALKVERLSRRALYASGEAQRWWSAPGALSIGAAVFADAARFDRRVLPHPRGDVDAGIGARIALPGLRGTFRVDLARGLRDGATALSVAYHSEAR